VDREEVEVIDLKSFDLSEAGEAILQLLFLPKYRALRAPGNEPIADSQS
jgi:hypothetical protein